MKRLQQRLFRTRIYSSGIGLCILMLALLSGCAGAEKTLPDGTLQGSLPVESTGLTIQKTISASADSGLE